MTSAVVTTVVRSSSRLLADVKAFDGRRAEPDSTPAHIRLEAVLGRDLTDRLVSALSTHARQ